MFVFVVAVPDMFILTCSVVNYKYSKHLIFPEVVVVAAACF